MEAKPEETASLKAENQSTEYTRGADSNSFASCFVEIIQERSNSCMEVEQPIHHQEVHSDKAAIQFWQTQKLPSLKEEMRTMYNEGLPIYQLKPLSEGRIKELLQGIDQDIKSDNNKEILIKILAGKIENSRDNQSDLAKKCKEYIESLGLASEGLDESFYMDMICNYATLKSHLNLKINYLEHFVQNSDDYEVWEIKNADYLKEIAETSQISVAKAMRKWKAKALNALDKFIKAIIKMKNADDFKKVFDLKDKYEAALNSKKPTVSEKKTPKANKRKHQNLDETNDKEIKETEKETLMITKKPKLTPAKGSTPPKKSEDKLTIPKSPSKEVSSQESTASKAGEPKSETKKSQESAKKDKNTQSIMNFFKKKPTEQSETKPEYKAVQVTQPSRFKCLGSLEPRSKWEIERSDAFEKVLNKEVAQLSIGELLEMAKQQQVQRVAENSTRKIYINIHDSIKRIKGKYEVTSNLIKGRNPLAKDEVIIDYDIDSEDEIQECNAENIDEEGRSENDESDLEEENEKDFIVPDGYVSADEKPEDISDSEENDGKEVKKTGNNSPTVQFKEDLEFKGKPKAFFFNMTDNYQAGRDMQLDDYLNKFKVIKLLDEEFPLKPKKAKPMVQAGGKTKLNPEAINDDDIMKALILSIHGEFSKQDTVININTTFPSCSKKSIEKKLVELENSELIKKEKVPGETKSRWIVQKEYFLKFGTEEDYSRLLVEKRDKEIERLKLEKEKRDNEKKLKQMSQVQVIEVPDVKKGEEEEIKENSNGKLTIIRKTVQTELAFGNTKLTPNKGTPSKDMVEIIVIDESSNSRQSLQMGHAFLPDTN